MTDGQQMKNPFATEYQNRSYFTLLIYFRDGYTKGMKFHSWKQERRRHNGVEITDHRYALNRLVWLIEEKFKDKYKTAIIYHNESGDEIMRYAYGMVKSKELFEWVYDTEGNIKFKFSERVAGAPGYTNVGKKEDEKYYV